ncbi:hypothetical protein O181_052133 [Austropuccinia psidii MF-1]|uniref:Uncharacterized protein n=1 Tax=Austropuccinia psidii MF-1 TaxID=1389203 RepID=A0A9Q3E226_9BASI|nr:hypothetical protein [Austropuccinia psidii MF-1]
MLTKPFFPDQTNPSEPTLPRHVRPKESPSSPTPGTRATSTPATEQRTQTHQSSAFFSTPTNPSPLQKQINRQERTVVKIKTKYYSLNFNGEEVEIFIRKVERRAQIKAAREEDLAMEMEFWATDSRISDSIKAMPGYEQGPWSQLKQHLITKWGKVDPERRYEKDSLIKLFKGL